MTKIGLWQISNNKPTSLKKSEVELEKNLEDWIEIDPSLVQTGITIIGRQFQTDAGPIDLLGIDSQGRWAIIEIKRGDLRRDTIAQVIDYASCIATESPEELEKKVDEYLSTKNTTLSAILDEFGAEQSLDVESRELLLFVVGTGKISGLERMVNYLSDRNKVPITLVAFEVFETENKERLLAREITEPEYFEKTSSIQNKVATIEEIVALAEKNGIGDLFRSFLSLTSGSGVYPRPYLQSIMFTPPSRHDRMLFTVVAKPTSSGKLKAYISPAALAEFYPISENDAEKIVGLDGWRHLDKAQTDELVEKLRMVIEKDHYGEDQK